MNSKGSWKLTGPSKELVFTLLAMGMDVRIIADELKEQFGIDMHPESIRQNYLYKARNQKRVKEIREKMDAEISKHVLASSVNQLNIIMLAIKRCLHWGVTKQYFDKDGCLNGEIQECKAPSVAPLIREARAIVAGNPDLQKGDINVLQIIRDAAAMEKKLRGEGETEDDRDIGRGEITLDAEEPAIPDMLDSGRFRDLEIL